MVREVHEVVLTKYYQRAPAIEVIERNADLLSKAINNRSFAVMGWSVETRPAGIGRRGVEWHDTGIAPFWTQFMDDSNGSNYRYEMYLQVIFEPRVDREPDKTVYSTILSQLFVKAKQPAHGSWMLTQADGEDYEHFEVEKAATDSYINYSPLVIPENWDDYFAHLYGLGSHTERIRLALNASAGAQWNKRFSCVLIGPPGCGKSDICQSVKRALGEEAVMEFDATATTAAGAINQLITREILPRVLIVEEIEKADPKMSTFLLGVMDLRGEIRKTTARDAVQRDTKLFAIATVNDEALFDAQQAGALSSRFSNRIYFRRPNREMLGMILTREVGQVGGDTDWIDPALDYCQAADITDPRQVISICLCGGDLLVTGEYQRMLAETGKPLDVPEIASVSRLTEVPSFYDIDEDEEEVESFATP